MRSIILAISLLLAGPAFAERALIAVATNFAGTAEALAEDFQKATGHTVTFTAGATGKIYAQIVAGAPFDAFLSADETTPARIASEGKGLEETRFSYATGTLVLWTADPTRDVAVPAIALASVSHVAVANPDLAPYGRAAIETLSNLGLADATGPKIVTAENIGQAYSLVATGAAELGFVAKSSVIAGNRQGASWEVPPTLHAPIRQAAILLNHGKDNAAARAFLDYLRSDSARETLSAFGYGRGE